MDTARISMLLEPFLESPLPPGSLVQISMYIDLLLRWNARVNLTAVREPEHIVTRHFGESLFLARHLLPLERGPAGGTGCRVIDLGSGAGFPGLPLKIWDPSIDLTLIESNHKKAAFLREIARELTLTAVKVITERAVSLASLPGFARAGLVTLRAVERFEAVVPVAVSLIAPQGRLALLIGASQVPSLASLSPAIQWSDPIPIPQSASRVLIYGSIQ